VWSDISIHFHESIHRNQITSLFFLVTLMIMSHCRILTLVLCFGTLWCATLVSWTAICLLSSHCWWACSPLINDTSRQLMSPLLWKRVSCYLLSVYHTPPPLIEWSRPSFFIILRNVTKKYMLKNFIMQAATGWCLLHDAILNCRLQKWADLLCFLLFRFFNLATMYHMF
jgi:hypothetical protein